MRTHERVQRIGLTQGRLASALGITGATLSRQLTTEMLGPVALALRLCEEIPRDRLHEVISEVIADREAEKKAR